jgi:hypothetical protein
VEAHFDVFSENMGTVRVQDVLCMRTHDEEWKPSSGLDSRGILVLEITPDWEDGDARAVLPFVHVGASVRRSEGSSDGCVAWLTVLLLAVGSASMDGGVIPCGRYASLHPVFGEDDNLDYVHPWVDGSGKVVLLNQRSDVISELTPKRVSCVGMNGEVIENAGDGHRLFACVAYCLEGCEGVRVHAQAGICGVEQKTSRRDVCGKARVIPRMGETFTAARLKCFVRRVKSKIRHDTLERM